MHPGQPIPAGNQQVAPGRTSSCLSHHPELARPAPDAIETIFDVIGNTRTLAGQRVKAAFDATNYSKGAGATNEQMDALSLHRHLCRGEWGHELHPRTKLLKEQEAHRGTFPRPKRTLTD